MVSKFSIRSTSSDRELVFRAETEETFHVELLGTEVAASRLVWAYTDAGGLLALFKEIGSLQRPWAGAKSWESLEGEFCLSAICSALGTVLFKVQLSGLLGSPEEWHVTAGLTFELGQLSGLAQLASAVLSRAHT